MYPSPSVMQVQASPPLSTQDGSLVAQVKSHKSFRASMPLTGLDPRKDFEKEGRILPAFSTLEGNQNTVVWGPALGRSCPLQTKDAER